MKKTLTTFLFMMLSLSSFAEIASGTCGPKLTWSLSDDYTLTIDGEGDMTNWSNFSSEPWYSYRGNISKLSIGEKVTSIGDRAFSYCTRLTNVTISLSVTNIGSYAFSGCSGITSLTIPHSVKNIRDCAFRDCSGLVSITIPNSVTFLGKCVFYGCSSLTSVSIPNSLTSIGEGCFHECSALTSVIIPNSINSIEKSAFLGCSGITSLTIPNSVTSIGESSFYGCSGLTSVIIPNSVTSIGGSAFADCTGLTSLAIPNSVKSIGFSAFSGCSGLTSVIIPNSVTSIGGAAFNYCTGLTSVTVDVDNQYYCSEDNVIYTKDKSTLVYCMMTKKGKFTIPNSVTSIGNSAFSGCSGLTSLIIPNSVTSIDGFALSGCSGLTSLTIPNTVTVIGSYAFLSCSGLTSVIIPNSVTSIGDNAFYGDDNIQILHWDCTVQNPGITLSRLRELYIGDNVETIYFTTSSLQKAVLGKNVKYIRQGAFKNSKNLKEFYITGMEVPYLYPDVFKDADLSNATLYVPSEKAAYYKTTEPWRYFGRILDLEGNEPSVTKKCATPSIAYEDGQLYFVTATPKAEVVSAITVSDAKTTTGNVVSLNATYNITAYAKRTEYENSDVATATLHWMNGTLDVPTGTQEFGAKRAVLVNSSDGFVSVSGLNNGEMIDAYSTDGKHIATTFAAGNAANIASKSGETIILKIGGEAIKVIVK